MNTNTAAGATLNRAGVIRIITVVAFTALQMTVFFIAAGDPTLVRGWIYFGLSLGYVLIMMLYIFIRHPEMVELVNERGKYKENTKWWDKLFMVFYTPVLFAMPALSGLDVSRFRWSETPFWLTWPGIALFIASGLLVHGAMIVNRHFETTVRIQDDREHSVVSTGPYGFIRHPGYLGMMGLNLAFPLITGSLWSLVPAGMIVLLLFLRTGLEDRMLRRELPGYDEYAHRVRHRLVPLIW